MTDKYDSSLSDIAAILAKGRHILCEERDALSEAIQALEASDSLKPLGRSFVEAVQHLSPYRQDDWFTAGSEERPISSYGRVIVTGMGKSGHIACKIAATLASTGTPAMFVHPAEAGHGDLGMITRLDTILALSNSGESTELTAILHHAARWQIPVIAMTSKPQSSLARAAKIVLCLPIEKEAGTIGLAPTVSTTISLALGDALAITLMELHGFSHDNFRQFHPGGALGIKLLPVSELMNPQNALPLCTAQTKVGDAILIMTSGHFGCVGIEENHKLIGIITDGDLRRHLQQPDLLSQPASAIMTGNPFTLSPTTLAAEAVNRLNQRKITVAFVTDETGKALGILHLHDLIRRGAA